MTPQASTQRKFPPQSLKSIKLQNILSFGPEGMELELKPLNVLIGPNASGKSNLIDTIRLLHAAPLSVQRFFADNEERAADWIYKGTDATPGYVTLTFSHAAHAQPLTYTISLAGEERLTIPIERLETQTERGKKHRLGTHKFFEVNFQRAVMYQGPSDAPPDQRPEPRVLALDEWKQHESLLSQFKDPGHHPEITYAGKLFEAFHVFVEWNLGRGSKLRRGAPTDLPTDFLLEDCSNLPLVLNDFEHRGRKPVLVEYLQRLYEHFADLSVRLQGGVSQLFVAEQGLRGRIPPSRLSDGTLRYLCLIAILCHPEPPPLICIEEPELGLHPDALASVAKMLVDASERCQLIVTTHSPELIDELSSTPESIVVCERTEQGTQMHRLDPKPLKKWIDEYRLGGAWKTGVIGGRR